MKPNPKVNWLFGFQSSLNYQGTEAKATEEVKKDDGPTPVEPDHQEASAPETGLASTNYSSHLETENQTLKATLLKIKESVLRAVVCKLHFKTNKLKQQRNTPN